MHWKALLLAGCLSPLTGCMLARDTARNALNEPAELHDNHKFARQLRRDAKAVWAEVCQQYPQRTFTPDFVEGFTTGYIDYLDSGGTAQPPAMPPLKYRRSRYMSVEGHALIHDYFCGFKYGCEVAAASGKRDLITVPILLPEPPTEAPVQARQIPIQPIRPMTGPTEPLPKPKSAYIGTGLPLLDRPLATIPPAPVPAVSPTVPSVPMSIDAPTVTIPVIDGPPKFTPPMFEFPAGNGPRSALETAEQLIPSGYIPVNPAKGVVPPLREIPSNVVKPYRLTPETQPRAPWRGD